MEVKASAPSAPFVAPPIMPAKVWLPEPELTVKSYPWFAVEFKVEPKEMDPLTDEDRVNDDPIVTGLTYDCKPVVDTFVARVIPPDPVTVRLVTGVELPTKALKLTVELPALTVNAWPPSIVVVDPLKLIALLVEDKLIACVDKVIGPV